MAWHGRAQKKGYEEVHVPAVKHVPVEGETLVPIEDLPKWVQPAFKVCVLTCILGTRLSKRCYYVNPGETSFFFLASFLEN